jgi:hypothetical protein
MDPYVVIDPAAIDLEAERMRLEELLRLQAMEDDRSQ